MDYSIKKIAVTTLGCKVNQCDSASIEQQLRENGYSIVAFANDADCYIINTCAVTASTEAQSRQLIRRALRRSETAPVVVTGCYAQKNAEQLRAISARVHVAGNTEKETLPLVVDSMLKGEDAFFTVHDISMQNIFTSSASETFAGRTRAFLKIQDGCSNNCAYCIVPSVRGPSRSLMPKPVLNRMRTLARNGYKEIVLTGIHLGAWGWDLKPRYNLADLLTMFHDDSQLRHVRLRLSSIEPTEWSDEIIELVANSNNICPHVHIPLQSGDSSILKSMNRDYSPDFFSDLVLRLVRGIPSINIGIDVIAGLPGETVSCFDNTRALLDSLPAGYLHVFPYSRRPGTPAADMPEQVPAGTVKKRLHVLWELSDGMKRNFYQQYEGAEMEILVESRRDSSTGLLRGFTRNYIPVLLEGDNSLMNSLQKVTLARVDGSVVHGSLV
jgi:threonylcarbamoyladenosine tRNA methylthiotransferase MtaB